MTKNLLLAASAVLILGTCSSPERVAPDRAASLEVAQLACEGLPEPLGIDEPRPRLSWTLRARDPGERGLAATAHHVLVASRSELLAGGVGDLWDSGPVDSPSSAVEYGGEPLRGRQAAWWTVRVRDPARRWSEWSAAARWCTGPLTRADWGARWIGAAGAERALHLGGARWIVGENGGARSCLRRAFRIEGDREVTSAQLLLGCAEPMDVFLDGASLATLPGGTQPVELDVTARLAPGAHALALATGGRGVLARLRVFFREGTDLRLASGADWRASAEAPEGWTEPEFADEAWPHAVAVAAPGPEHERNLQDSGPRPDPWLRKTFTLDADVCRATAWVASLGYHELHANGAKVGEAVLAPGLSDLTRRVRWVAYDLTGHLARGPNTLGLWLSAGWARFERFQVAQAPLVLARLDVELADGRTQSLVTDGSWLERPSPSTHRGGWGFGDFGGERWDAAADDPRWCTAAASEAGWSVAGWNPVVAHEVSLELSAKRGEPDRRIEALAPRAIEARGPGAFRVDMGRSFTGFLEAELRGEPGATVTLSWSERAEDETTYAQVSECVLDGHGRASFRNRFDYAAGRWLTLRGPIAAPAPADVRGWLVRSGFSRATEFACSDPLLNEIHATIAWTFECLSQGGVLADCPHRERLGYGGDAHATFPTGLTHFALGSFYADWLEDWRDAQGADGGLPYTAPTYGGGGGPAWSGIVATLPWELYVASGERRVLGESYPTAKRWLDFAGARVRDGLLRPYGDPLWGFLGDWVPPGRGQGSGERVDERSTLFLNNAFLALAYERAASTATALGLERDARVWTGKADALRAELHARFFDRERASYANGEQPYLALALLARVVPAELRPAVLARLEHEIRVVHGGHVDSGIHGTAFLLQALAEAERHDLVYELARQTSYPGWGHMLAEGATTIWEQWDGVHSRLHSSFLSLGAWFVQGLAGIRPDPAQPGYERVVIRPAPVGDLTWARARFATVRGPIAVEWRREGARFALDVSLPPGTSGTVFVPSDAPDEVREGDGPAAEARGVTVLPARDGSAVFRVGSGEYRFRSLLRR